MPVLRKFTWLMRLAAVLLPCLAAGCATSYRFLSTPEGATVYQQTPTQKVLLGETPIDYAKTGLPAETPFVVTFEKDGYEARDVAVSPTDNALTTVTVQLKPKAAGGDDGELKRLRGVVKQIFSIQEQIYQKRYVDALAALKVLEAAEPHLPEVSVIRGSVYALLSDPVQARREWERALELDPSLTDVQVHLAKLPKPAGGKP